MAKKDLAALQKALDRKPEPPPQSEPKGTRGRRSSSQIAPSREGKVPLIAYLSPAYKRGLKLIQAKQEKPSSNQDLMAEALNMLFEHYKVPTVSE